MKKEDLRNAFDKIDYNQNEKRRLKKELLSYEEKEIFIMSKKKIAVMAIAAVMVLGCLVYAGGNVKTWRGHSSAIPDFLSIPDSETCMDKLGFVPVIEDEFENGFTFKDGNIIKNEWLDDNDNSIIKFKSLGVNYERGDEKVFITAGIYESEEAEGVAVELNGESVGYYDSYVNKVVPPDYKLTAEDRAKEESGELVFSYGSGEVTVCHVQGLSWEMDGIEYNITVIDTSLEKEDLTEMANEMINE